MADFVIITDSSCDLPAKLADELELTVLPLSVLLDGHTYLNYLDEREISFSRFYSLLRQELPASTSSVNPDAFSDAIEPLLLAGLDVLYLGFSSALSSTYDFGKLAMSSLQERYPARKLISIDTLCASLGQGLLVFLAAEQKRLGKSIEEVAAFVRSAIPHLCHWFTVDDLHFLKRGGRVSSTTATIGSILNIKPVMHMDDNGCLVGVGKVRGRKASIRALAEKVPVRPEPAAQRIFISHGDCLEDAQTLAALVAARTGVRENDILINHVGPVIGAHSGPGTLALFFLGDTRN